MTLVVKHFLKLLLLLFLFSCSANEELSIFQGEAYGTTWQVKFYETETNIKKDDLLDNSKKLKDLDILFKKIENDN